METEEVCWLNLLGVRTGLGFQADNFINIVWGD